MLSNTKASILCFPQKITGNTISLNVLFVPRENPLAPFTSTLVPDNPVPSFAKAKLKFNAKLIPSLEFLPSPTNVNFSVNLQTGVPANAENIFLALQTTFNINLPSNELKPLPKNDTFIRKYLPKSYRNAFDFSYPRSPKFGVVDDAYLCAMKQESPPGPKTYSTDDVSWGKVFALALRQPVLAERLGMIYRATTFELPSQGYFKEGGWLYVDLSEESDYYENALNDPALIKKYAARLPKLTSNRVLFAPIQFLVTDVVQNGNFDPLFMEAADFDDGFANIVHCAQPQKANPILEQDQDGLPAIKDFGIRIGWEDEQILDWHNRLLRRPDHLPTGIPLTPENIILDAPLGILSYRIDVKDVDDPLGDWHSLNKGKGSLKIANIQLAQFEGELGVEVAPTQMDGFKEGIFWLPSYFSQWDGNSVVLKDDKAAELYGLQDAVPKAIKPLGIDEVQLRYGNTYQFRVRMSDMTGGGPTEKDKPFFEIPSQKATCRFRRFVPPARVRIGPLDLADGSSPPSTYEIYRPLLGYPSLLYTDLEDAFELLKADIAKAKLERREPAYPDPDVTMLKIEVALQGLEMDNLSPIREEKSFYPLFTTTREFPITLNDPLELEVSFVDANVIKFDDAADLGDLPLTEASGPLMLPTARDIRITVSAVCKPDPDLKYFGTDEIRYGRSVEILTRAKSKDESSFFIVDLNNPGKQLKAILLQPDEQEDRNQESQMHLAGKKEQSPQNLMSRFANALNLDTSGMTLMAKAGQRIEFGCCKEIRHILSPEHSSITFSSKADLINQWIPTVILTINRDWSWNASEDKSFTIKRNGTVVGTVKLIRTVNNIALQNPDRSKTTIIFFDAVDPKPENDKFPELLNLKYEVEANLTYTPVTGQPESIEMDIILPVAVKPSQIPKVASAGIALSPYERDSNGYAWNKPRKKMLWVEFEEPILDSNDNYFVFVKSYGPDPLLTNTGEAVEDPREHSPYIDAELIRIITPGQSDDRAALSAMQQMISAARSGIEKPKHFLVPLPSGISESSPELFGFFTYEICVGHANIWCTAQARYGRSVRVTGVQHPPPSLICSVTRNDQEIIVSAPHATAVYAGKNLTYGSATELWGLLYAQVVRVDGKDHRNVLLSKVKMSIRDREYRHIQQSGYGAWSNKQVEECLYHFGIPENAPLSCLVVELFPNADRATDPLGGNLGYTRIYRTSQLEPVPEICCVNC